MGKSVVALVLSALIFGACGDSGDDKTSAPTTPTVAPGGTPPAMSTVPLDPAASSWTGTVEPAGVSIHMQGSHKLVDGGKTVVFLQSTAVDLAKYVGKRVKVTGTAAPTVEGSATIVTVTAVTP
jgi:hypothetical protein